MKHVHPGNFECFMDEYSKQLKLSYTENPQRYSWTDDDRYLSRGGRIGYYDDTPDSVETCYEDYVIEIDGYERWLKNRKGNFVRKRTFELTEGGK